MPSSLFIPVSIPPLLAIGGLLAFTTAVAQPVLPAHGVVSVQRTPGGATIVGIAPPNAAGVSHNQYRAFHVNAAGLVLNNAVPGHTAQASALAGALPANPELKRAAEVILNEVVSPDRSVLAGATEVYGARADVVVANPYGITCHDCAFLNTDRVTLTTGIPQLDGRGALAGFDVTDGEVLFSGVRAGPNSMTSPMTLDVAARRIMLDGKVYARDVALIAGVQRLDYRARQPFAKPDAGQATSGYGIDSTTLGGMYGERIRLITTDVGSGVRTRGTVGGWHADVAVQSKGHYIQGGLLWGRRLDIASEGMTQFEGRVMAGDVLQVKARGILVDRHGSAWANSIELAAVSRRAGLPLFGDGIVLNLGDIVARTRIRMEANVMAYTSGRLFAFDDVRIYAPRVVGDHSRIPRLFVNDVPAATFSDI